MAMVNVRGNWPTQILNEIESVEIYNALINILHSMADDDAYTVEDCFKDIQNVALEVRRSIDECEFPDAG